MSALLERFDNKNVVIGILGLCDVGIPLGISITDAGFRVIGFEYDLIEKHASVLIDIRGRFSAQSERITRA